MGSFSYTCAVSGLPIHDGDKVRYMLLSSNPYNDQYHCTMGGLWFPRTFPLKAKYNDYGSVEDVEKGIGRDLWHEGLKIDLLSVGTGENTIHDVPTSKDMSFDELLNALVEGRVRVNSEVNSEVNRLSNDIKKEVPIGVPTIQRIKNIIQKNNLSKNFIIDKRRYGEIRVRWSIFGKEYGKDVEKLSELQPFLTEYVTVLVAGKGLTKVDLLVHVRPGTEDFYASRDFLKKKSLNVSHVMIREDVWQSLLSTKVEKGYSGNMIGIDDHIKETFIFYKKCVSLKKKLKNIPLEITKESSEKEKKEYFKYLDLKYRFIDVVSDYKSIVAPWLGKSEIPYVVGLGEHWELLFNKGLPLNKVKPVLTSMAEFVHVYKALQPIRFFWRPSNSVGPQFGEWDRHIEHLEKMLSIARIEEKRYDD